MKDDKEEANVEDEAREMLAELLQRMEEEMKHIKPLEEKDYPVTIKSVRLAGAAGLGSDRVAVGAFVSVRLAGEDKKTYLGIYLGSLPVFSGTTHCALDSRTDTLLVSGFLANPAMFVPDLNRVVYGMESWWGEIKSADQLRAITDEDIENVWYVKAMKQFEKKEAS